MHYYQFNIGDYASHTAHLDEMEDLAYRRMIDYCYLNECGLPETVEQIARVIRMRLHCNCIASVLQEFFTQHSDGTYHSKRVDDEIEAYHSKSNARSKAARKRWENGDAIALQTECKSNANHKPLTINQEPGTNLMPQAAKPAKADRPRRTKLPTDFELTEERMNAARDYWRKKGRDELNATEQFGEFLNHHTARGSTMADWDAAWRTWYGNAVKFNRKPQNQNTPKSRESLAAAVAARISGAKGEVIEGEVVR